MCVCEVCVWMYLVFEVCFWGVCVRCVGCVSNVWGIRCVSGVCEVSGICFWGCVRCVCVRCGVYIWGVRCVSGMCQVCV